MATLTEVTWMIRKGLVYGSIGSVLMTIFGIGIWMVIKSTTVTPPVPTPTPGLAFGTLPAVEFMNSKKKPASYELLLIEGKPPEATPSAKVYFIPKKAATLFSRKNALDLASSFGFTGEPQITDTTMYAYADPATGSKLTIDTPYKYFHLSRGSVEPAAYKPTNPDTTKSLLDAAYKFFSGNGVWSEDLKESRITFVVWTGSGFVPDTAQTRTSFVRVGYYNPSIEGFPIVTDDPQVTNVYATFGTTLGDTRDVLEAKYIYYAPDVNVSSTYPTISGQAAWDELVKGNGYIASSVSEGTKAVIRRIYLAYFHPDRFQPYLQPVWVFEGDAGFVAYVHAIDPQYITKP